jgi:ATP-dependent DNA helicase RecG
MFQWTDPVGFLKKVTPAVRKNLAQLEVETIADLLLTLPRRYDDYSRTVPIREAPEGQVVTVKGTVTKCAKLPTFRKRFQIIRVGIQDETGSIAANFFNQPWLLTELTPGKEIVMSGKVVMHPRYGRSLEKPLWEPAEKESVATGKVAPVYPLTGSLSQNAIRQLVPMALAETTLPPDPAEDALLERHHLLSFADALKALHQPESLNHADRGRERLAFDELMTYRLSLGAARIEADTAGAPVIPFEERFAKRFAESLPFPLTADQKRAVWAAIKDMEVPLPDKPGKARPMRRLLQGDVGSGKTAVAAFLCAHIQRIGASAVILAPTDILAQHHDGVDHLQRVEPDVQQRPAVQLGREHDGAAAQRGGPLDGLLHAVGHDVRAAGPVRHRRDAAEALHVPPQGHQHVHQHDGGRMSRTPRRSVGCRFTRTPSWSGPARFSGCLSV